MCPSLAENANKPSPLPPLLSLSLISVCMGKDGSHTDVYFSTDMPQTELITTPYKPNILGYIYKRLSHKPTFLSYVKIMSS